MHLLKADFSLTQYKSITGSKDGCFERIFIMFLKVRSLRNSF